MMAILPCTRNVVCVRRNVVCVGRNVVCVGRNVVCVGRTRIVKISHGLMNIYTCIMLYAY